MHFTPATQVQSIELPPTADMTSLVTQINALNVDADVQTYYDDAAAGLNAMENTRNISQQAM